MSTCVNKDNDDLIHGQLLRQARARPNQIAIMFLDQQLTYQTLYEEALKLALKLQQLGVKPGDRVGIYKNKSLYTPIALYGVLLVGAAYVPLDPAAPIDRIATVVKDCDIACLISANDKRRDLIKLAARETPLTAVLGVDSQVLEKANLKAVGWEALSAMVVDELSYSSLPTASTEDLAYIIYTSGSTGLPKGMMHTHRSCMSYVRWAVKELQLSSNDRLSNHAPLHFDLSIFDFFASACCGASTVIIPEEYTRMPASYSQLIADHEVTVLYTVPFALIQVNSLGVLEQRNWSKLRWIIFAGEVFPSALLSGLMQKLPHVSFDNMYGPAETNAVSHYVIPALPANDENIPIGSLAEHCCGVVVDKNEHELPAGEPGELLIASPTLMSGYWQRDELNAKVFVERLDDRGTTRKFFRTGDMVCVDPEFSSPVLRFIGRKDRQVKIRGYRIELDEIELALSSLPKVEEAVVVTLRAADGSGIIHAEATITEIESPSKFMQQLKKILPWYALPAELLIREVFPRGTTGKINRRLILQRAQQALENHEALGGKSS